MKRPIYILLSIVLTTGCLLSSCGPKTDDVAENPEEDTKDSLLPPVETLPPNTNYQPAFDGQTRAPGDSTKTPYIVTEFATGLNRPWGMANLPDGRIIVTEKAGSMRLVSSSGVSSAISGIPAVNSGGQGGLMDVAIDPDFEQNRIVYWSYSKNGPNGTATAVAKGRLSNDESSIESVKVIYTAIPEYNGTLHYGSRLEWDGNANLFLSTGERSDMQTRAEAQELDAALGKIIRIDTAGNAVADNPFIGQNNVLPEIYSYGHRNPQGLAIHPETGDLWEAEFGPRGGDEINLISAGKDYGWPTISYGIEYNGAPIGDGITQKEGMEQPVYYWDPVISPSGITFYTGNMISEWKNNLFLACLSAKHVARLVIKDNKVVCEERLLEDKGQRIRDVLEGKDGALYAITDSGVMYRIGV